MKKEKLFKIGIINESTLDVVKDMTTFYTSDTELWLGFELSEVGVEFDSAEILMFNIDNKSFVVRSVVKTDDKYWYELDMDMIAHHGQWKSQLQFTKNNEVYTSKHFNFRIENDLSYERPPKLVDITNWSNIKQTADSLIAEMKVAVTEAIAAEQNRAEIFVQAEQSRQTTFNTNEDIRQMQELERGKAEGQRQTVFDGNEAVRTEIFNANEATRQVNETTRQQAESQRQSTFETNESERQSAEQQRIEAEILRVERDSSREVEITNLKNANFININNLVKNGAFSDGGQGWVTGVNVKNIFYGDNYVEFEGVGSAMGSATSWVSHSPSILPDVGDILYVYSLATRISGVGDVYLGSGYFTARGNTPLNNKTLVSYWGVPTVTPSGNNVNAVLSADKGVTVRFESVIYLNLTQTFGAGNEPSKEVLDWIIKENGYFDELTISRDYIQQYEINQLRKAVIALGGTI